MLNAYGSLKMLFEFIGNTKIFRFHESTRKIRSLVHGEELSKEQQFSDEWYIFYER